MKKIAIFGSTGSIGTQALDIIEQNPELFCATVLTCGSNVEKLSEQITRHRPSIECHKNQVYEILPKWGLIFLMKKFVPTIQLVIRDIVVFHNIQIIRSFYLIVF